MKDFEIIEKYKAIFVVKGFRQKEVLVSFDTYRQLLASHQFSC